MAFVDTRVRKVLSGVNPVHITLSEAVVAGDPLGISATNTWVLSADAAVEQPQLIAGEAGAVGDKIVAYQAAVVECVNTAANVATLGEKIAVGDTGLYVPAGGGFPDVGYVASVSADATRSVLVLLPVAAQLTVVRS